MRRLSVSSASRITRGIPEIIDGARLDPLASWHTIGLLEALQIPRLRQNLAQIAEALGTSEPTLRRTLDRLISLGLVRRVEGKYEKTAPYFVLCEKNVDRQNASLRSLNQQFLRIAAERIRPETTQERYLGTETFAFSKELLPEARQIIDDCLDDLVALSERCSKPETVYHAGVQFFELLRPWRAESA